MHSALAALKFCITSVLEISTSLQDIALFLPMLAGILVLLKAEFSAFASRCFSLLRPTVLYFSTFTPHPKNRISSKPRTNFAKSHKLASYNSRNDATLFVASNALAIICAVWSARIAELVIIKSGISPKLRSFSPSLFAQSSPAWLNARSKSLPLPLCASVCLIKYIRFICILS